MSDGVKKRVDVEAQTRLALARLADAARNNTESLQKYIPAIQSVANFVANELKGMIDALHQQSAAVSECRERYPLMMLAQDALLWIMCRKEHNIGGGNYELLMADTGNATDFQTAWCELANKGMNKEIEGFVVTAVGGRVSELTRIDFMGAVLNPVANSLGLTGDDSGGTFILFETKRIKELWPVDSEDADINAPIHKKTRESKNPHNYKNASMADLKTWIADYRSRMRSRNKRMGDVKRTIRPEAVSYFHNRQKHVTDAAFKEAWEEAERTTLTR